MSASPYELLVGTRYLRGTRRRGFLSFIAVISVVGLMLGVATLIVVLSVMNGFEQELRTRILAVTSHATLMGLDGPLPGWRNARAAAEKQPGVLAAVPYIEVQAMFAHGRKLVGSLVRGVEPAEERRAVGIASRIQQGSIDDLAPGSYKVVLGTALAQELGVKIGEPVVMIAPEGSATPTGLAPRVRRFMVSGIFDSGMYEYDRGLALVNIHDAARVYRMGDDVTGIRLALTDPLAAPAAVRRLALSLGGGFYVSDWTRRHSTLFRSIESTKSMLFVILSMLIAVAAFNIVATLVMIVKDKQTDIAILRTMGAGPRNVMAMFLVQGVLIGLAGIALGMLLGVVLSANVEALVHGLESLLGTRFLDARVYPISDLPAQVLPIDLLRIGGFAFLLCALATIYPAWRAARTAPAQALRHD